MNFYERKKILFLDFCSEKNRGDAAMQVGLINLAKKYLPIDAKISVISVFGTNQLEGMYQEYDHSTTMGIELLGGLKPTFYPLESGNNKSELIVEFLNALFFVPSLLLLLLASLKIPVWLLTQFLSAEAKKTLRAISESDIVIWNGRNLRSRNNSLLEIYRIAHLLYHPLLAMALSKQVSCLGVSVWEFKNPITKKIIKNVFERCYFVSLREENSYHVVKKILGADHSHHIHLLPDLSFAAYEQTAQIKLAKNNPPKSDLPQKIGFTIVDWKSDGNDIRSAYKTALQDTIRFLLGKGSQVVLIPQVTKKWEHFEEILQEIITGLNGEETKKITLLKGEPTVNELLNIYAQLDLLVATRMHSAIFASTVQTPLIAISYDQGGKWGILEKLGFKDFMIPYSEITSALLIERIGTCWKNKESLLKETQQNVTEHIQRVDLNMSLMLEFLAQN